MFFTSFVAITWFACTSHATWALSASQIQQQLRSELSPGAEVALASSPAYAADFEPRFATAAPPSYLIGVKPATITDVQQAIRYARKHGVPILATGGAHGYSWSLDTMQGGINLDLGNFQSIEIDAAANTMTVGGAARFKDITPKLQALGKEFPVGVCQTVGIGGWSLGGGIGPYSGIHGAGSDSLLSVEMVTGTGQILTVSAESHPDLFYGIRGAGHNYGVVTSFTFRIYPATNNGQVTVVNTLFPGHLNASIWELSRSFVGRLPKELILDFSVGWNSTLRGMAIIGSFYYIGPRDAALHLIQPFLDLDPLNLEVTTTTYAALSTVGLYGQEALGSGKNVTLAPYAVNLYDVDVENLITVFNYMNTTMAKNPHLQRALLAWKQIPTVGFQQYSVGSSAFPFRDVAVWLQYDGFGTDNSESSAVDDFGKNIRDMVQEKSGSDSLEVYLNFAHGNEGPEAWWTEDKLPVLKGLKAKYDPTNLFHFYNPLVSE